jgi:benzoylformate decarboxylase
MAGGFTKLVGLEARRGADILLEVLESEGVEYIFGNPGTTELPLIDALLGAPSIHYVLALQEATAVAMADGYASAAGKPGFLNLHTAGGLGHGMGNLLNAGASQTPLVVTAGQQDSRHTVTDPLLFADLVSIAGPVVKWAREVTTVDQLPILTRRAFHDASAAPSGPVFLSLPMNVMDDLSMIAIPPRSLIDRRSVAGSLRDLAAHLASIRPGRLAIIAGDEIHSSRAAKEAAQVAEILGAPVYGSSWPSRIPFPTAHPMWAGNLPTQARAIADILSGFDAIFALGGKSLITILYTEGSAVPDGCDVFQLSADVADLGRTYHTKLSVFGDIAASLQALIPMLACATEPSSSTYAKLVERAAQHRTKQTQRLHMLVADQFGATPITPLVAAAETARVIGPDTAIVDEAIATSSHLRRFLNSHSPAQYSFFRGGGLGWGMPAAVGCSLGLGREPVICIVGDGAAMYSPQAMWTAVHEKLPVTFVVMNNMEYNVLKNFMKNQQGYLSPELDRFLAMDIIDPSINYIALARSMGLSGVRVTSAVDIAPAIEAGMASGQANLIEIVISGQ